MSDEKPKPPPAARPSAPSGGPPKLERVPEGYKAPAVRPAQPPGGAAPPSPAAPVTPSLSPRGAGGGGKGEGGTPAPAPKPPGSSSYGLAAREVGADAAIAAGIAHEGSLASESGLYLFSLAAASQATGRLTLTAEGCSVALSFRRGTVEHAASSGPGDDLGAFLVRRGAVRQEGLARAEAAKPAVGGDLVSALIAERLVNPADVAQLLQEHGAQIVQRALAVEAGGWAWDPQAAPPAGAFPLGAPYAMLCAAVRALDAAALTRRLGDREHRAASRVGGRVRIEDLRLTPQETRAAGLFDGTRSPAELASSSPGEALVVLRLAVLLGELQLLAFGASRKGAPPPQAPKAEAPPASAPKPPAPPPPAPKPVAAKPAAPAPGKPPAPARPPASPASPAPGAAAAAKPRLEPAALAAQLAKLAAADHFAVLGVKQDAAPAQVKAAYFQLAKSYHPDAVPADAPPEVKKLCADVFAKVSEAWSVLGDDASRAAYLDKLKSGGTVEVDVMNIFQAENVFQAGAALVKARKYDEALRKFEEALRLNPDEAEFGMWKAWCEFLLADDKKRKLAPTSAAIEAGLKKNPRCAQGYLFLGQMAKLAGDISTAERHLRRGLEVAPEHADLQRELKYLKK